MPPRGLPGNANLEQLKNGAKSLQRHRLRRLPAGWAEHHQQTEAHHYFARLEKLDDQVGARAHRYLLARVPGRQVRAGL